MMKLKVNLKKAQKMVDHYKGWKRIEYLSSCFPSLVSWLVNNEILKRQRERGLPSLLDPSCIRQVFRILDQWRMENKSRDSRTGVIMC